MALRRVLRLVLAVFAISMIAACGGKHGARSAVRGDDYFESSKAKYRVDGRKYQVPMGYQWYVFSQYGQWPTPNDFFTDVDSFEVAAVLPGLDAYSSRTRAEFEKRQGAGKIVSVTVLSRERLNRGLKAGLEFRLAFPGLKELPGDPKMSAFKLYRDRAASSPVIWFDLYVPKRQAVDTVFWVQCLTHVEKPVCTVYDYSESMGKPQLQYYFAIEYLEKWATIRQDVHDLVDSFR
jgi:hypothetical protein